MPSLVITAALLVVLPLGRTCWLHVSALLRQCSTSCCSTEPTVLPWAVLTATLTAFESTESNRMRVQEAGAPAAEDFLQSCNMACFEKCLSVLWHYVPITLRIAAAWSKLALKKAKNSKSRHLFPQILF